jgi:hypothetical protein
MSVRIVALLAIVAGFAFAPANASAGLFGHCKSGCDAAPSCGCEVAAPSCGCEAACDPCAAPRHHHHLLGGLKGRLHGLRGCCGAASSCGCEAAPSCCAPAPAPSCGCEAACDPCAAPRHHHHLLGGLKGRLHGLRGCCAPAPSCGCEVAAPSCGCGM